MFKYLSKLIVILGFYMFFANTVLAASNLSLQIETPKAITNKTDFNITFVALDITNKPVTVKCFRKRPTDAAFDQFGPTINLSAGGDTNNCIVDSTVINSLGIYNFYVTASTDTESVTSPIVKVDYNNVNPGNPTNYSKEKINSCDYKIKFRTADDAGKTIKVIIYRSDLTSFKANTATEVNTIMVGSSTDKEVINSVPDCNKNYYFVLKAVDNWGNSSDIIGDSFTTTVVSAGKVAKDSTGSGAIKVGKAKKTKADGSTIDDADIEILTGTPGAILGTNTSFPEEEAKLAAENKASGWKNILLGLIAGCVLLLAYVERENLIKILREKN